MNVRRLMGVSNYEGIFTYEDLKDISRAFYFFDNLEEIHLELIKKLTEEKIEFFELNEEEGQNFLIKFDFRINFKIMDAFIKLNKSNNSDTCISKVVDDMGIILVCNSNSLQVLHTKLENNEKSIEDFENKFAKQEECIRSQQNQIIKYEEKFKRYEEKFEKQNEKFSKLQEKILNLENKCGPFIKNQKNIGLDSPDAQDGLENLNIPLTLINDTKKCSSLGIENSNIIKEDECIDLIKKWIDEINYKNIEFKLLYRASRDGLSAKEFHNMCDNQGSTITLCKTTSSKVFGGFTNLDWDSTSGFKGNDPQAFIFSIDHKIKLTCHDQNKVINCRSIFGPTFGGGDISIENYRGSISTNSSSYSDSYSLCGISYGKNENITSKFYLIGYANHSYNFIPEEIEVYSVIYI